VTRTSWDVRSERAGILAEQHPACSEVMRFYQRFAEVQGRLFNLFSESPRELTAGLVRAHFPALLDFVLRHGTGELASRAAALCASGSGVWEDLVLGYWRGAVPDGDEFFARAFLQPYAELAYASAAADVSGASAWPACCPRCGRKPQVAVLREEAYGARRSLVCSLCQGEWQYRRVICPACGEHRFDALPVYTATEFSHMRVEACDTCKTYLLSVDMTKDGRAVPCVDELAALPLNLWAREQGYNRLQSNLLGL
jgi:hypothetical protein